MKKSALWRGVAFALCLMMLAGTLAGCGGGNNAVSDGGSASVDASPESLTLPLAEKVTLYGLTNFPAGSESEPNNRTIFKRLEEATNVHVEWRPRFLWPKEKPEIR